MMFVLLFGVSRAVWRYNNDHNSDSVLACFDIVYHFGDGALCVYTHSIAIFVVVTLKLFWFVFALL